MINQCRVCYYLMIVILASVVLAGSVLLMSAVIQDATDVGVAKTKKTKGQVDALAYRMDLKLDEKKDRLYETVFMTFKNRTNKAVRTIVIRDMNPEILAYARKNYAGEGNKGKRCRLESVAYKGKKLRVKKNKTGSVIKVIFGKRAALGRGDKRTVKIRLYTDIPNRQDRFAVQKIKKGKQYALSFCFPYLADNRNGKWNKDPFYDDGESRSEDLADYKVRFTAPARYVVAATGSELSMKAGKENNEKSRKVGWKNGNEKKTGRSGKGGRAITTINAEKVRDFAIVASDRMKKETFTVKGIIVNNYYLDNGKYVRQYRKLSRMIVRDAIRIYTKKIGRYQYKELDITECLFGMGFGGMEYPQMVMTNGSAYYDGLGPRFGAYALVEGLSHEIGHQWFYAAVGNNEYREGWIDEGFTSMIEKELFMVTDCPTGRYLRKIDRDVESVSVLRKSLKEDFDYFVGSHKRFHINIPSNRMTEDKDLGEVYYTGGQYFLHDVKNKMGAWKFAKFLRDYYKTYTLKTVTCADVVKMIRKHDGSRGMKKVIGYWIK